MPSPVKKYEKGKFYLRDDGAWIKKNGNMKQVGVDKYPGRTHYSKRKPSKDQKRSARENNSKKQKYPQQFD